MAAARIAKRYAGKDPSRLVNYLSDNQSREDGMGRIVQQVIDAIEASPLSLYELARRTGVSDSQLSRFVRGERSITIETLEKLCDELGIELSVKARQASKRKK